MDKTTQERLEKKGWKVGTASDFLALSPEEEILVEMKLALSQALKGRRKAQMTQTELASKLGSSQPHVTNVENGDASVDIANAFPRSFPNFPQKHG